MTDSSINYRASTALQIYFCFPLVTVYKFGRAEGHKFPILMIGNVLIIRISD